MTSEIQIADIVISVALKPIKHVHLSVYPPDGRVKLVAPNGTRIEAARAFAISKLAWIRDQRTKMRAQARESRRAFVTRETHYVWGRRYLLTVAEKDKKPSVALDHRRIVLTVRPGAVEREREKVLLAWQRGLLHKTVPALIAKWERKLNVCVTGYFLQRMKTRWGSCNTRSRTIRLNTELVKKPRDLLEYIIVHEMLHLIEPTHSERFLELITRHHPSWREARAELNELPLVAEAWRR